MRSLSIQDPQLLVLADASTVGGKGGLFERFIAHLLSVNYGFETPTKQNVNVTSDGIELDVVSEHRLTGEPAMAECKAYSRNVKASELTNFYGKLTVERFDSPSAFGLFCALPRLTPEGEEKAKSIAKKDKSFRYLSAVHLTETLRQAGQVGDIPAKITDYSDEAILVTDQGVYAACIVLDARERTPIHVAVWGTNDSVPSVVVDLLAATEYAKALRVVAVDAGQSVLPPATDAVSISLTSVVGSSSDFEYQFPASPQYFVGRKDVVSSVTAALASTTGSVIVLNAQSGWGKSSIALKMREISEKARGVSLVLDTRTADQPRYLVEVLREICRRAEDAGILKLPEATSWASLESALATIRAAVWSGQGRPVFAFFDQFENIFRDVALTRAFRDLALGIREIDGPFIIGFAWKTDLVGWTEGHPFQLRDDIRGAGSVITVSPFGPKEVDVILGRLAKQATVKMLPDLRSRLRAYSQGLPWLLKKLADHVLKELNRGATQEGLLAESLNIVALFEADLGELSPSEQELLRHVARFAPVAASEVTERFGPDPVQSLVNRRLVVQVGDRLDTYWDTFRDFLNTGSVPVQESWILRQTPRSVARLLPAVVRAGGDAAVKDLVVELETSDRAIFNLSRELRLLGVTAYAPNRVRLIDEVLESADRETEMRRRVHEALRRHRAYSTLKDLAERSGGRVTLETFARELPFAFPAVDVTENSWVSYSRAFLFWMEYAGLIQKQGAEYVLSTDSTTVSSVQLLAAPSPMKYRPGVPSMPPRKSMEYLEILRNSPDFKLPDGQKEREAVRTLLALGIVSVSLEKRVTLKESSIFSSDGINGSRLTELLCAVPGGPEGIDVLVANPGATPQAVGDAIAAGARAQWSKEWARGVGGDFRAWAKIAGIAVVRPIRGATK